MKFLVVSILLLKCLIINCLPIVDPGLFVIMGVRSCGQGKGYCLLGSDCTLDEDFLPDEDNGHCDGLQSAFTPRAHFICCRYNPQQNETTTLANAEENILTTAATAFSDQITDLTTQDDMDHTTISLTDSNDKLSSYIESLISGILNESLTQYSDELRATDVTREETAIGTTSETTLNILQIQNDQQITDTDTTRSENDDVVTELFKKDSDQHKYDDPYKMTTISYINDANTILIKVGEQTYNVTSLEELADIRMDNTLDEEEKDNEVEDEDSEKLKPAELNEFYPYDHSTENFLFPNVALYEQTTSNNIDNSLYGNEDTVNEEKHPLSNAIFTASTNQITEFEYTTNGLLDFTNANIYGSSTAKVGSFLDKYDAQSSCRRRQRDNTNNICWLVQFVDTKNETVLCAGAFVDPDTILTSAICTIRIFSSGIKDVKLISESDSSYLQSASIRDIAVHEEYTVHGPMKILNDIGVVRLIPDPSRHSSSCYLCLPNPMEDFSGTQCTAPTFTANDDNKRHIGQSRSLVWNDCFKIISKESGFQCQQSESRELDLRKESSEMPGSPLVCGTVLAGVASLSDSFIMYTPVGDHLDWIQTNSIQGKKIDF